MTNRAAKIYEFTLAANGSFEILAEGSFYKLLSAADQVAVSRNGGSELAPLRVGQGEENTEFTRITVRDMSGSANYGSIVIADNGFIDDRISGEVSVIDGEKSRSLAGTLFSAIPSTVAVAGQYPYAQLWNPAGSGKNLIVQQILLSTSSAAPITLTFGTVARSLNMTATHAKNKKAGAAIGLAQVRSENSASYITSQFWAGYCVANQIIQWKPSGPLIVPPGYGLDAVTNLVNSTILAAFEWYEETP